MTKMERQADDALDEQLGQHKNTIYSALGALAVLRDLNASNKRKLPTGTATAFLSTRWIQDRGVRFAAGLAETELEELQEAHSVIFPPAPPRRVKGGVNLDHFGGAKVDQLVKG